jgi:hypothetical protein
MNARFQETMMTEDVHATDTSSTEAQPQRATGDHNWNKGHSDLPAGIEGNPVKADDENTGDDITYEDATGSGEMSGGGGDG